MSKAVATKIAIVALSEAGCAADAYALTRHLLENVIILSWLLNGDEAQRNERIDTYIAHFEAVRVRLDEVHRKHASAVGAQLDGEDALSTRTREIATEVFQDKWMYWAWFVDETGNQRRITLREMAREVGVDVIYDSEYFEMSVFAHSAPGSVLGLTTDPFEKSVRRGHFAVDVEPFRGSDGSVRAVGLSNAFFVFLSVVLVERFAFSPLI